MEIETQELTTCEWRLMVVPFSLGFVDSKGEPATIRLSVNQVGALVMTLPGLISKALQARFGDQSLRLCLPARLLVIEQSTDPKHGMMTLRTRRRLQRLLLDPARTAERLGEALTAPAPRADGAVELTAATSRPVRMGGSSSRQFTEPCPRCMFPPITIPPNIDRINTKENRHGRHAGNSDDAPSLRGWFLQEDADRRKMGGRRLRQEIRDA
jgi:hypothetical protein